MSYYVPIFSKIVDSSLWTEPDFVVKVFITMLAKKDRDNVCRGNAFNIASWSKKSEEEVIEALKVLSSPDTKRLEPQPFEGRRIERVEDGWLILNGETFQRLMMEANRRIYKTDWQREKRSEGAVTGGHKKSRKVPESPGQSNGVNYGQSQSIPKVPAVPKTPENPPEPSGPTSLDIYDAYPRKLDRKDALVAIEKALKKIDAAKLLALTQQYAEARKGQDDQFTPYPASWFNGERYNDDPAMWIPKPAVPTAAVAGNTGMWAIQKAIDVKEELARELFNRHATETGLETTWDSPTARADYTRTKGEIKTLKEKMAKLVPV